jgi:hypothetical protein
MPCTIIFYRSQIWAQRFERVGIRKPEGMVCSTSPYRNQREAEMTAQHVNAAHPVFPCTVVEVERHENFNGDAAGVNNDQCSANG